MIRTLRITSIIAGILAISLIVPVGVYGIQGDSEVKELLNEPSIVDQYKKATGKTTAEAGNRISPLVEQAKNYSKHINPPPKPGERTTSGPKDLTPSIKRPTTAKFKLLGTSYNPADPSLSIALIDNPGDGLFWVRPSQKIGNTLIKEIKDGIIVYEDGKGMQEMAVEEQPKTSLIDTPGSKASRPKSSPTQPKKTVTRRAPGRSHSTTTPIIRPSHRSPINTPARPTRPIETQEDARELENIVNQLRDLKDNMDATGKTEAEIEQDERTRTELMEQLIQMQRVRASRANQQEGETED